MYVWSLALIILLMGCAPIHDPKERCEIAQMKVRVYESCYDRPGCYLNEDDRYYLVEAKTNVIRFCVNEGRL